MTSDQPIYIGVLFSKTGRTAVTERSMLAATEFAIEEINAGGGINGRMLCPIIRDPMGEPSAYQKMAAELISGNKVRVILGCYTSSQRKAVLSVVDREAALLCYAAQYEGFEYSENIVYFGAVPNQNSVFLAIHLLRNPAPRLYIVGSDYVWPRESGRIMGDLIRSGGGRVAGEAYLDDMAGSNEFDMLIKRIRKESPDIIFNNFVGEANRKFYESYIENGLDASRMMVASLTTSEADIREIGASATLGHITAASYFASQSNSANRACLARYRALRQEEPCANMCWDAAYTQTHVVAQAMRGGDPDSLNSIRSGILGASFEAPQGVIGIDALNAHCNLWPKIGVARTDGQFEIVAETETAIRPDPYRTTYEFDDDMNVSSEASAPETLRPRISGLRQ
ncbi:transporter substrate-binding domain-containing protein [Tabrizicola sp.]|uniref:transporter substrate-binding domain-containing protein n=1 Tax=Tabrizicola sp. TaxID=2005166 RepID=UPI002FDD0710